MQPRRAAKGAKALVKVRKYGRRSWRQRPRFTSARSVVTSAWKPREVRSSSCRSTVRNVFGSGSPGTREALSWGPLRSRRDVHVHRCTHARRRSASEPCLGHDLRPGGRANRARVLPAGGLHPRRHAGAGDLDGRRGARREPVHALRRRGEGSAAFLHRRGAPRGRDPALRAVLRRASRSRAPGGDRRIRGDDGGRDSQRRPRHPAAGARSVKKPSAPRASPPSLVLASHSPRRRQLLEMLGIRFEVVAADIPEVRLHGEAAAQYARRLAREKARAVPGEGVRGAATIVVVRGEVLEKPADADDALRMLRQLEGRRHEVITAICLVADGAVFEARDSTLVFFRPASDKLLRAYVATGEVMDKAGAYAIQGYGAALIDRIEGDFFSVMGLPVRLVLDLLRRAGWDYRFETASTVISQRSTGTTP